MDRKEKATVAVRSFVARGFSPAIAGLKACATFLVVSAALAQILSASTGTSTPAQAGRGRAPAQEHLNRVADAILKLKSAQFTLTREGTPAFLDEKMGVKFTAAQCVYAAPERVSCNVRLESKTRTILYSIQGWL